MRIYGLQVLFWFFVGCVHANVYEYAMWTHVETCQSRQHTWSVRVEHRWASASIMTLALTRGRMVAVYQPQTARQFAWKSSLDKAFVRKSALFREDWMSTIWIPQPSLIPIWDRNQWYRTASDLERGVRRGGSVVARILAARLLLAEHAHDQRWAVKAQREWLWLGY